MLLGALLSPVHVAAAPLDNVVVNLYRQMVLRTPSTAEASTWAALLAQMPDRATVGAIIRGCFASGEFQAIETAPWIYE